MATLSLHCDGAETASYELESKSEWTCGRSQDCDINFNHGSVSLA